MWKRNIPTREDSNMATREKEGGHTAVPGASRKDQNFLNATPARARPVGEEQLHKIPSDELDPWRHRHEGMRCRTCMFFVAKVVMQDTGGDKRDVVLSLGRCRRHAPTLSGYPAVFVTDWCGDHKLDENK